MQHRQIASDPTATIAHFECQNLSAHADADSARELTISPAQRNMNRPLNQISLSGVRKYLSSKAEVSFRKGSETAMEVLIHGPLNDEAPTPTFPHRRVETIAIDWSGMSYIASAGVVSWLNWLKLVHEQSPNIKFEYKGCPLALIQIFRQVSELRPKNSALTSLQVPYRRGTVECSQLVSVEETSRQLSPAELFAQIKREISSRICDLDEGEEIEIDLTEDDLAFLTAY